LEITNILSTTISVPVRIVDPSKDLNSYGLSSVDWKERVESWRNKQDKHMMQVTHKYPEARGGDAEGTGSNGEDMQMYTPLAVATFHYTSLLI
jgi:cellulose synthase A